MAYTSSNIRENNSWFRVFRRQNLLFSQSFILLSLMQPSIERGGGTPNILKNVSFYYKDSYCIKMQAVERFHMTSLPSHWCPKTMKRQPCWCPKRVLFFPFVKSKAFFSFQYITLICTAADHLRLCCQSLSQNAYLVL